MARQAVTEVRKSGRARLEWSLPVELKAALAHAAVDEGTTIAALLEQAVRAYPAVARRLAEQGPDKSPS